MTDAPARETLPDISLAALFGRFLRCGLLAWGGPAAQIDMLRHEHVERARWVSRERFNRVLAVYQALPGPEATELCIYLGQRARGRAGGLVAGIGFLLPGVLLVLAASWAWVWWGVEQPLVVGAMAGAQAAAAALVLRAALRLGSHAILDLPRAAIAVAALALVVLGADMLVVLAAAAVALPLAARVRGRWPAAVVATLCVGLVAGGAYAAGLRSSPPIGVSAVGGKEHERPEPGAASDGDLLVSGLRAGALTFGGAYTAVPFVREDAVVEHAWLGDEAFLQGVAVVSVLPTPLVSFATFVGFVSGGVSGALVMTFGIFLPAFAITLLGHRALERLVSEPRVHAALDGVAAAVPALVAVIGVVLAMQVVGHVVGMVLLALSLVVLTVWQRRAAAPVVMLAAAAAGALATPA